MKGAAASLQRVGVDTRTLRRTLLTWSEAPCRTMDSRTRTPAPTVTPSPMETLGPSYEDRGRQTRSRTMAPSAPQSIALVQGPPGLHSPLQCCRWRPSGGCTRSLQHKAAALGEAACRSTCLSHRERFCPRVPVPPKAALSPYRAAPKAVGAVREVPRMTGPPGLFWASLSGWLLLYWFR